MTTATTDAWDWHGAKAEGQEPEAALGGSEAVTTPPKLKRGDRIVLLEMPNDPDPILIGEAGTVTHVSQHGAGHGAWQQVEVLWDRGRQLMLTVPPDKVRILPD
jgi:hypothetical protein